MRREMIGGALAALMAGGCAAGGGAVQGKTAMTMDAGEIFTDAAAGELGRAIARGDVAGIRKLANPQTLGTHGRDGVTMLEWAILRAQPGSLKALLDAGADPALQGLAGDPAMHLAVVTDDPVYLKTMLAAGVSPNLSDRSNNNALVPAIDAARRDYVGMLLKAKANPNQADIVGDTPLHKAAMLNDFETVLLLLDHGANPALRNKQGDTFQSFVFRSRRIKLTPKAEEGKRSIQAWLSSRGIPVESGER